MATVSLPSVLAAFLDPNPEVRNPAIQILEESISENRENLIFSLISTLIESSDERLITSATTILSRALSYDYLTYDQLVSICAPGNPNNVFGNLINITQQLFQAENPVLRNNASKILAILFALTIGNDSTVANMLKELVLTQSSFEVQNNALEAFINILLLPDPGKKARSHIILDSNILKELTSYYFDICLQIMAATSDVNESIETLKITSAKVLTNIFKYIPDFIEKNHVDRFLEVLPASLQYPSVRLFKCLHSLMYRMTTSSIYVHAVDFFPTILDYTLLSLSMEDVEYSQHAVSFVRKLAEFEFDYIKNSRYYTDQSRPKRCSFEYFQHIISKSSTVLLPKLLEILQSYNEADVACETRGESTIQSEAGYALEKMFLAAPEEFFSFVQAVIPELVQSTSWPVRHSAVILLACICVYPILSQDDNESRKIEEQQKVYCNFAYVYKDYLVNECRNIDIPQLRDSALFALARVLKFNTYQWAFNVHEQVARLFQEILPLMIIDDNTAPFICEHILGLLGFLCSQLQINMFNNPMDTDLFNSCNSIIEAVKLSKSAAETPDIFLMACDTKMALFDSIPYKIFSETGIHVSTLETTIDAIQGILSGKILYPLARNDPSAVLGGLCAEVANMLNTRMPMNLTDYADSILGALLQLCGDPNAFHFQHAVTAIARLLLRVENNTIQSLLENSTLLQTIYNGLVSMNTETIISSCNMVRLLFDKHAEVMCEFSQQFSETLLELIKNEEKYGHLLNYFHALTAVLRQARPDGYEPNEEDIQNCECLLEILRAVVNGFGSLGYKKLYHPELNDHLYLITQSVINMCYSYGQVIRMPLFHVAKEFQTAILDLSKKILYMPNYRAMKQYIAMIDSVIGVTIIQTNRILNNRANIMVVRMAITNPRLRKNAYETLLNMGKV